MSVPIYPSVEVVQEDQAEAFRRGMRAMRADLEANRERNAAERAHNARMAAWGLADSVYLLLRKLPSREGEPDRYRAEALSGMPDPSMSIQVYGESPDDCIFEARHAYADALEKARVERTREGALRRACKATFNIAEILGL